MVIKSTERFPALSPERRARALAPPSGLVEVVIDTDPTNEIDDQFAVAWGLLRRDRLAVVGLHACPFLLGPELARVPGVFTELDRRRGRDKLGRSLGPAEAVVRAESELRHIATLVGAKVPVIPGAPSFMPDSQTPVRSESADHLIEASLEARDGPLYVAAIGCLTNVASALLLDPTLVERIVVVWTAGYPASWARANVSYNMCLDLAAAEVVLESGVPLVYLPGYYVAEELRVSMPDLRAQVAGRGALGDYLYRVAEPVIGTEPGRSRVLWDLIAIAWLAEPAWVLTDMVPTPVLGADLYWGPVPGGRHLMLEAYDVDRDAIIGDLFSRLGSGPAPATPTAPAEMVERSRTTAQGPPHGSLDR